MLPDRVSNPEPLTYESCALPTALRGPAGRNGHNVMRLYFFTLSALFYVFNKTTLSVHMELFKQYRPSLQAALSSVWPGSAK